MLGIALSLALFLSTCAGPQGTNELTRITNLETNQGLTFTRDPEESSMVYVDLDEPLAPGEQMQVEIAFSADIPQNALRFRWTEPESGKPSSSWPISIPSWPSMRTALGSMTPIPAPGRAFTSRLQTTPSI